MPIYYIHSSEDSMNNIEEFLKKDMTLFLYLHKLFKMYKMKFCQWKIDMRFDFLKSRERMKKFVIMYEDFP